MLLGPVAGVLCARYDRVRLLMIACLWAPGAVVVVAVPLTLAVRVPRPLGCGVRLPGRAGDAPATPAYGNGRGGMCPPAAGPVLNDRYQTRSSPSWTTTCPPATTSCRRGERTRASWTFSASSSTMSARAPATMSWASRCTKPAARVEASSTA
ncbi:hypothetical protein ACVWZD_006916 [Streptomyces sp. TE3672]